MQLGFETYEEAKAGFSWEEAWKLVDGTPNSMNATEECLDRHSGTAVQIKESDGSTTVCSFEELSKKSARFAHYLNDIGISASDRVAIMLNPSEAFLVSFFGTMKHGASAVPCSELFGPDALEYRLEDSGATLLVTSEEVLAGINPSSVEKHINKAELSGLLAGYEGTYETTTSGGDEAWVQYTSGTTGRPTAVPYAHESIALFAPVMDFVLDFQPGDSCFTTSSTGWGTGIWIGTFAPLIAGIPTGYFSGPFDPHRSTQAILEFDVNILIGIVPTAFRKMVNAVQENDLEVNVDKANYVGEPIDAKLSQEVTETLGAFPRSTYGVTEVRSIITLDYAFPDHEFKHGSMGRPLLGVDVAVVDEDETELPPGEVGYIAVRRSEEWIITSDAGYCDEDGYLWSAGRMDDTIISAGYTIGPAEVEDTLLSHGDVVDAGVIGIPDEERSEVVKAYIVTSAPETDRLREDIRSYVREKLSKHEYPREIDFIDDLPKTPDGKVQRNKLRDLEGIEG